MKHFISLHQKIDQIMHDLETRQDFAEEPTDRCPYCDGYGNIIDEKGARLCECAKKEVIRFEIEQARIPKHYHEHTLQNFESNSSMLKGAQQKALSYIANYSLENHKGLYIYGPTGAGKTHISIGILKGLIERGFDGVFYNIVDLLDTIRATYDPQHPLDEKNRLEIELNRQIFVLDDFGVQKTSSWVQDRLYALINRRYQDCKTIIITSNMTLHDLELQVDKRLSSRIIEMCEEIEIVADDYRKRTRPTYHDSRGTLPMRHNRKR